MNALRAILATKLTFYGPSGDCAAQGASFRFALQRHHSTARAQMESNFFL